MALRYGLAAGLLTVTLYFLCYLFNIDLFLSQGLYWVSMVIYIFAMYHLSNKIVESGLTTFKEIVRPLFICFLVANGLYYAFYFVMITSVDPEIYQLQIQRMSTDLQELDMTASDTEFKIHHYILSYFQAAIGGFVLAATIAYSKKQS